MGFGKQHLTLLSPEKVLDAAGEGIKFQNMNMYQKLRKQRNNGKPPHKKNSRLVRLYSQEKKQLIIICVVAIVLKIVYLVHLEGSIFFGNYILDSEVIDTWAKDIAGGNFWGDTAFFRAPLYIYIVAFIYKIFGSSPLPVIIFQDLLGLLTIIITYFYARMLFGSKVAFFAGIIMSCWLTLIYFEGELMITSLSVFFLVSSLLLLHRAIEAGTFRSYFIGGIFLGLAAITRPTFLPIFFIIPLYYLLSRDKSKYVKMLRHSVIYLVGLVIPIIPVTIRNVVVANDFVIISSQGGANFYIGNSKSADGISVEALGPVTESKSYYEDNIWTSSVQMAQYKLRRKLKNSEVSSYWFKETLKEMADQPARAVGLLIKKFYYFWHGQEIFNNKSLYSSREYSWLMRFVLWKKLLNFPSGVLFPLMLVGIYYAIKSRQKIMVPALCLLIYSTTISLFFVCSRFRQPVIPVAIILAAYGIWQITQTIRQGKTKGMRMAGGIFLLSVIVLNFGGNIESTINLSQSKVILGTLYDKKGIYNKAIENYEAALAVDPENMNVFRTKPFLQNAIKYDRKYASPYLVLGALYEREGNKDSARYIYNQLLQQDPNNVSARQRLSRLNGE